VFSETCQTKRCSSIININEKLTIDELDFMSVVNLCPEDTELMESEIIDWIEINNFLIKRE
jgi:hypothetical protein